MNYHGVAVYTQDSKPPHVVLEYELPAGQYKIILDRIYKSPFNYKAFTLWGLLQGYHCVGFVADVLDVTMEVGVWALPDKLYAHLTAPRENCVKTL